MDNDKQPLARTLERAVRFGASADRTLYRTL